MTLPNNRPHTASPTANRARTICVFAGSNCGASPAYAEAAQALARALVEQEKTVVYGGGARGLMGAMADEVLRLGGTIVGVIPESLAKRELAHPSLSRLEVVHSMHERKHRMASLADAFIALPGGIGTFEEVLEAATLTQLRIHHKPVALYNCNGYYDGLIAFLEHATREQFLTESFQSLLLAENDPTRVLARIDDWRANQVRLNG